MQSGAKAESCVFSTVVPTFSLGYHEPLWNAIWSEGGILRLFDGRPHLQLKKLHGA
jgi:hypothetical protein